MRISSFVAALLLSPTVTASQIPIIEKDKLSKVISESRFLSLHRAICEIQSVTNQEYRVGTWIKNFLQAHHFKVITQEVPYKQGTPPSNKPRLNVYSYPDPKYYKSRTNKESAVPHPKVLLTSHIDTVPPHFPYALTYNSSGPFDRGQVLISGRGTVDDKACVATQITVAMDFLTSPPKDLDFDPTDIALLFVVDEESGGMGMRYFSDSELYQTTNADYKAILFGEPTERKLVAGHKGIFNMKIYAQGKAAHSGYPWLGRSANSLLIPILSKLEKLGELAVEDGGLPGSEKFGNTTVNIGLMQGGVASNVVPEHAFAELAFRLAGGTSKENIDIVDRAVNSMNPDGFITYNFTQGYGPIELDTDVEGFETITVNYGTDIPGLNVKEGVKRYLYGPGTIFVAHGPNEGLTVGELEAGLEGYKRLLEHALKL